MPFPRAIVTTGTGLKTLGVKADGTLHAEGYLVRFTGEDAPDLAGDYFTKDTDFGPLSDGLPVVVGAYFDHGYDATIKRERIGTATLKLDDEGVFAEYTISRRQAYLERVLKEGHLGQSSGAVAHLVETTDGPEGKAQWIKAWPLGDASLTPTPAEPTTNAAAKAVSIVTRPGIGDVPSPTAAAKAEGESLSAFVERVSRAFYRTRSTHGGSYGYVADVYPDHVIAFVSGDGADVAYRIGYTDDGSETLFDDVTLWQKVERVVTYEPAAKALADLTADLTLSAAIKAVRDSLR